MFDDIGRYQKIVAGLQRHIPAGIKLEHGLTTDQHRSLRFLLIIPEPLLAGLAVGNDLFEPDARQVEEGPESLCLPRRGIHEVLYDGRHLLPIPDNGNHSKRDGAFFSHLRHFRSVPRRLAGGKLPA